MLQASALAAANSDLEIAVHLDYAREPSRPEDKTPWAKVGRIRNRVLDRVAWEKFNYLLWIDADVVEYPADMPTRLLNCNPDGISAPMVYVEDGTWKGRFYDTCGFIIKGKSHIEPDRLPQILGRNLCHDAPYWPAEPTDVLMEMDCVGTITLVPSVLYRHARYEDHPAFTDHFSICQAASHLGMRTVVNRNISAFHAELPKYGEPWH